MLEVLLVGNPNSGKTTLFNSLTRSHEHVGNWHGVTVENKKKAFSFEGQEFLLVDTPGLYSLCPLSFEEQVACEEILRGQGKKVVNLCDGNNLKRSLYLTLCLLENGCDCVVAVNQIVKRKNSKIDFKKLEKLLGVDVIEIDAEKGFGLEKLKKSLALKKQQNNLPYLKMIEKMAKNSKKMQNFDVFCQIKAFERDEKFFEKRGEDAKKIFEEVPKDSVQLITKLRFEYIDQILSQCQSKVAAVYGKSRLDKFILNKWLAFPIFLAILSGIFYLTFFSLGAFLSDLFSNFLSLLTNPILGLIEKNLGNGLVYDFFASAVFGGVATVLSFLPQVVLLFFFLSILEDSGYMARVAFIFEDILSKVGLSGKGIYTLLMGFGCSTSAIMTSRNMEDKNAKIKTAILCPYMSCSAKIPIYTVIGGAFFGAKNIFYILGLYVLGVVVAICISKVLDKTVLKSKKQSFILEFPPYRMTSLKRIGSVLWKNTKDFVIRVGSVMVSMNIIIWLLSSFSFSFKYVAQCGGESMLEGFGKILAPIFRPLGFGNWAIVASLLSGLVAKEVVVSSIAMFNGIDASATRLLSASLLLPTSLVYFSSHASVVSFLVYCLLYTPCIASVSTLLQEIGKKWTILSVFVQLVVAYFVALVTYNIFFAFEIFGFFVPFLTIFSIFLLFFAFFCIFSKIKKKKLCSSCDSCDKDCAHKKI